MAVKINYAWYLFETARDFNTAKNGKLAPPAITAGLKLHEGDFDKDYPKVGHEEAIAQFNITDATHKTALAVGKWIGLGINVDGTPLWTWEAKEIKRVISPPPPQPGTGTIKGIVRDPSSTSSSEIDEVIVTIDGKSCVTGSGSLLLGQYRITGITPDIDHIVNATKAGYTIDPTTIGPVNVAAGKTLNYDINMNPALPPGTPPSQTPPGLPPGTPPSQTPPGLPPGTPPSQTPPGLPPGTPPSQTPPGLPPGTPASKALPQPHLTDLMIPFVFSIIKEENQNFNISEIGQVIFDFGNGDTEIFDTARNESISQKQLNTHKSLPPNTEITVSLNTPNFTIVKSKRVYPKPDSEFKIKDGKAEVELISSEKRDSSGSVYLDQNRIHFIIAKSGKTRALPHSPTLTLEIIKPTLTQIPKFSVNLLSKKNKRIELDNQPLVSTPDSSHIRDQASPIVRTYNDWQGHSFDEFQWLAIYMGGQKQITRITHDGRKVRFQFHNGWYLLSTADLNNKDAKFRIEISHENLKTQLNLSFENKSSHRYNTPQGLIILDPSGNHMKYDINDNLFSNGINLKDIQNGCYVLYFKIDKNDSLAIQKKDKTSIINLNQKNGWLYAKINLDSSEESYIITFSKLEPTDQNTADFDVSRAKENVQTIDIAANNLQAQFSFNVKNKSKKQDIHLVLSVPKGDFKEAGRRDNTGGLFANIAAAPTEKEAMAIRQNGNNAKSWFYCLKTGNNALEYDREKHGFILNIKKKAEIKITLLLWPPVEQITQRYCSNISFALGLKQENSIHDYKDIFVDNLQVIDTKPGTEAVCQSAYRAPQKTTAKSDSYKLPLLTKHQILGFNKKLDELIQFITRDINWANDTGDSKNKEIDRIIAELNCLKRSLSELDQEINQKFISHMNFNGSKRYTLAANLHNHEKEILNKFESELARLEKVRDRLNDIARTGFKRYTLDSRGGQFVKKFTPVAGSTDIFGKTLLAGISRDDSLGKTYYRISSIAGRVYADAKEIAFKDSFDEKDPGRVISLYLYKGIEYSLLNLKQNITEWNLMKKTNSDLFDLIKDYHKRRKNLSNSEQAELAKKLFVFLCPMQDNSDNANLKMSLRAMTFIDYLINIANQLKVINHSFVERGTVVLAILKKCQPDMSISLTMQARQKVNRKAPDSELPELINAAG
jgi:hypothetical protein